MNVERVNKIEVDDMMWEICGIEMELEQSAKNAKTLKETLKTDQPNNQIFLNNNNNHHHHVQNDVSMQEK